MRIGSLFSGAGGLDLAALELFPGSTMAWHSEIEPAACKVLAHHWPEVPNLGDVSRIDWATVEPVDVLTGGFPCQDLSLAGQRRGMAEGTRSGLWSHMFEAIRVLRPRFVLIENVRGLLSAQARRGDVGAVREVESGSGSVGAGGDRSLRALGAVLGDLSGIGFDACWVLVRASDVGACHQRARVFVLAYAADSDRAGLEGAESAAGSDVPTGGGGAVGGGVAKLLPTPQVADVTGGHRTRSGARSGELLLPGLVEAVAAGSLLSTPQARDFKGVPGATFNTANLCRDVAELDGSWGDYAPAIRRQELLSRPAPSPTEANKNGNQRLSPAFGEWMMFWPAGWVTNPAIGLKRAEQLKCVGNGVVPTQAVAAFRYLLGVAAGSIAA
ncbi:MULTISPECIES: DNA cytosine methyltransferase [Nocardia]|uniref:DNA cytosine methyltransferase n=1 Tax=Nocardia TaxID=1817 RepID=UPI000D68C3DE|nr:MULTISPECIES: DNA cytosine methyltransferase [Nocardia]